jgi:Domain of unknown function (DUF4124)
MPTEPTTPFVRCALACALLCALVGANATTLYRWVDANGVTHWSDRPVAGSTPVDMGPAQSIPNATAPASHGQPTERSPGERPFVIYSGLEILAPSDGAVLFGTGGSLECRAQLTPSLAPGHTIWFEIDGQRTDAHGAMSQTLTAPRGTHVLRVVVTDAHGQEQIVSAPVTVYVRQTSIAEPPVGPTLKKPH